MNINRKYLYIALGVLGAIILGIVIYVSIRTKNVLDQKKVRESNLYEVKNNNSFITQYGDNLYYFPEALAGTINKYLHVASAKDENSSIGEQILKIESLKMYNSNIIIFENKMFYKQFGNTYMIDFKDRLKYEKFCEGDIQYIDANKALVIIDGNLYNVPYFSDTYKPQRYGKIIIGNLTKLSEDENVLYFKSVNENGIQTIVGVDKSTMKIIIYDSNIKNTIKINDFLTTNDYLFYLATENNNNFVYRIDKKNHEKEIISLKEYKNISIFKNDNKDNIYFLSVQDDGTIKKYICKEDSTVPEEFIGNVNQEFIGNYTITLKDNKLELYKGGKYFTTIETDARNLTKANILDIATIDNNIYYKIYYTNSTNLEVTEDMLYNRPITLDEDKEESSGDIEEVSGDVEESSGDIDKIITKTNIYKVSSNGEKVQLLK